MNITSESNMCPSSPAQGGDTSSEGPDKGCSSILIPKHLRKHILQKTGKSVPKGGTHVGHVVCTCLYNVGSGQASVVYMGFITFVCPYLAAVCARVHAHVCVHPLIGLFCLVWSVGSVLQSPLALLNQFCQGILKLKPDITVVECVGESPRGPTTHWNVTLTISFFAVHS